MWRIKTDIHYNEIQTEGINIDFTTTYQPKA